MSSTTDGPGPSSEGTGPVGVPGQGLPEDQAERERRVRLRLDLGYDGTGFSGWARQPGLRTVQGTLEEALGLLWRTSVELTVAGRTDAGVHARGQVCHVDAPVEAWAATEASLVRRLAGVLPADVRVRRVAAAPPGFDARFAATSRRYAYRLRDDPAGADPLERAWTVTHPRPLDLAALQAAAALLLGEHDFAAFCRRREGATTIRRLLRLEWARDEAGRAVATVEADAFCHSMVRALVGGLLAVGDGRREPGWLREVLDGRVRDPGVTVAPAHGLVLEAVGYPPDDQLAARVVQSRRVRTLPGQAPGEGPPERGF
ncbi:tRNA pseudouridine38-40 synthase [Motilibacter peucedani]|uniref:tRNA pseudouridine synthase A n=1 Tax=Motilibacter peucedani TaxID=598650 RepID=A0A420XL77_9ACTN|nr:tRNA pseudouridine(38-40) synthase TruA [Motilibacter peucedani]RKS69286.1 tRNA pseudouridine38-40 synthase [Motilibacter peucedani]